MYYENRTFAEYVLFIIIIYYMYSPLETEATKNVNK